ncbi:MAG: ATP-binding protein [Bacteroidales bacterium]|nr:ATP-binding protein [Bacteroidales bacterium]
MKEIALHILDIAQNSVNAGAGEISIEVWKNEKDNRTGFRVRDNGKGMDLETLNRLNDPFFTTGNKKTGLGIPLLRQHAEAAGGILHVESEINKGTLIRAEFELDHLDRQPMGDVLSTLISLLRAYPEREWLFSYQVNDREYSFNTRDIKTELDGLPVSHPRVIRFIRDMLQENMDALSK